MLEFTERGKTDTQKPAIQQLVRPLIFLHESLATLSFLTV